MRTISGMTLKLKKARKAKARFPLCHGCGLSQNVVVRLAGPLAV